MKSATSNNKLHYGWVVAFGCHIMFFYSVGLTTGTFAVFLPYLINEINLTNAEGSSILSVLSLTGLLFMLIVSKIFKRFGIRWTVFVCGLLIAAGNYIFSEANSLLGYYVAAVAIGIGFGGCSTIAVSILVSTWFEKRRGTAVGIAFAGSGMAAILFSPVLTFIIENYGLAKAFLFQSVSVAVLSVVTFLLIRNAPEDKGVCAYGQNKNELQTSERDVADSTGIIIKNVLRTKEYYIIMLAILVLGAGVQPVVTHLPTFLISVGYKPALATSVVSIFGITMVFGKTIHGLVIDKLGGYVANFIIFPLWLLTIALSFAVGKGIINCYLFAALVGIGPALATVSLPIWVCDLFKKENYVTVLTSIQIALNLGSSIGMVLMGYLFDVTGTYRLAFGVTILFVTIAFICMQELYRKSYQM